MRVFSGVSGVKSHSIPSNENAVCKRHNPPGDPSHAPTLRRSLAFLGVISAGGESIVRCHDCSADGNLAIRVLQEPRRIARSHSEPEVLTGAWSATAWRTTRENNSATVAASMIRSPKAMPAPDSAAGTTLRPRSLPVAAAS